MDKPDVDPLISSSLQAGSFQGIGLASSRTKRRKKKAPEQDVEYAYKAPQPAYLASLKKAVVAGEGRWFE